MITDRIEHAISLFLQDQQNAQKVVEMIARKGISQDIQTKQLLKHLQEEEFCQTLLQQIRLIQSQAQLQQCKAGDKQMVFDQTARTLQICLRNFRKWTGKFPIQIFASLHNTRKSITLQSQSACKLMLNLAPLPSSSLKSDTSKLHLSIYEIPSKRLISIKEVEWKYVLAYPSTTFTLELHHLERERGVLGLVEVVMGLDNRKGLQIKEEVLGRWIQSQKAVSKRDLEVFFQYSQKWFQEAKVLSQCSLDIVSIYTQTQDLVHRPLPALVYPIQVRGLQSPSLAHRFTSLIPVTRPPPGLSLPCQRFQSILQNRKGSTEDHCHLLCSMLLGMGLPAFVVVGVAEWGRHSWVATISCAEPRKAVKNKKDKNNGRQKVKVEIQFWETSNGQRYKPSSPKFNFYKRASFIYSNNKFLVNLSRTLLADQSFNLQDQQTWHPMAMQKLALINPLSTTLTLIHTPDNLLAQQQKFELQLRMAIKKHRKRFAMGCAFDAGLEGVLGMAVASYQWEKVAGVACDNGLFRQAVKQLTGSASTFVAVPLQILQFDAQKVVLQYLKNQEAIQLLQGRTNHAKLGLRFKLTYYGDEVKVGWAVFAGIWMQK